MTILEIISISNKASKHLKFSNIILGIQYIYSSYCSRPDLENLTRRGKLGNHLNEKLIPLLKQFTRSCFAKFICTKARDKYNHYLLQQLLQAITKQA